MIKAFSLFLIVFTFLIIYLNIKHDKININFYEKKIKFKIIVEDNGNLNFINFINLDFNTRYYYGTLVIINMSNIDKQININNIKIINGKKEITIYNDSIASLSPYINIKSNSRKTIPIYFLVPDYINKLKNKDYVLIYKENNSKVQYLIQKKSN